jgi:hypothetical protein
MVGRMEGDGGEFGTDNFGRASVHGCPCVDQWTAECRRRRTTALSLRVILSIPKFCFRPFPKVRFVYVRGPWKAGCMGKIVAGTIVHCSRFNGQWVIIGQVSSVSEYGDIREQNEQLYEIGLVGNLYRREHAGWEPLPPRACKSIAN